MLAVSVIHGAKPMNSQHLNSFHPQSEPFGNFARELASFTADFCNFSRFGVWWFAMLCVRVKPDHTRIHLKSETLHEEKQPNNGTNLVDVSRTLLRIVAQLPKTEYSGDKSNGHTRRQADEFQLDDLPDPASADDTSQG
jgi:hypothetical protein